MKRPPKIMHLALSLNVGGAERVAASLVTGSDPNLCEHQVCCLDEIGVFGEDLMRRGYRVTLLKRKPGVDWGLIPRLALLLRRHKVDIVHAHGETPWFYGALACALTFGRSRCITTVHGYGGGDRARMESYRLWRALALLSKKIVLVADNLRQELISQGFHGGKVGTILNGIDVQKISRFPRESRARWKLDEDAVVIGIVARLSAVKNHRLLLQAVAGLAGTYLKMKLIVVGDGPEREALQGVAEELGIGERVVFCGEQDPALGFYGLFDIFVLPSLSEGISMTLLEAVSCRVPIVASRVGGNAEIIFHEETGLLFESGDLEGLQAALETLMQHPERGRQLAQSGFEKLQRQYSFERMIGEYHDLYASLI